jgi:hypothetical protein
MSLVICFRTYRALDMRYNTIHHLRLPAAEGTILCTGLRWVFYRESSFGRAGRSRVASVLSTTDRPCLTSDRRLCQHFARPPPPHPCTIGRTPIHLPRVLRSCSNKYPPVSPGSPWSPTRLRPRDARMVLRPALQPHCRAKRRSCPRPLSSFLSA